MPVVLKIAWRYFFSKSGQTVINRINGIALVVIVVATAALMIVLSAFAGLKDFGLSFLAFSRRPRSHDCICVALTTSGGRIMKEFTRQIVTDKITACLLLLIVIAIAVAVVVKIVFKPEIQPWTPPWNPPPPRRKNTADSDSGATGTTLSKALTPWVKAWGMFPLLAKVSTL